MRSKINNILHNRKGEIGTIVVLIGMAVVGLGILVGSQIRNQNINIAPRAAAAPDPLWGKALSSNTVEANTNVTLWSGGGPKTGWESFYGNRAYICNGKWCWTLNRDTNPPTWENEGKPFDMSKDANYRNLKSAPGSTVKPWTGNGPTAAWTWVLPYNGQTVNETMLCNGNYCWRYIRYPNGVSGSGWRDGGAPIDLSKIDNVVWRDSRIQSLWSGNGLTVGWVDPVHSQVTLCNGSNCRSLDYKNWQWRYNGEMIRPFPSGVTQFTSGWTSPATNNISLCTANNCYIYSISNERFETPSFQIAPQPTNTPQPTVPSIACRGISQVGAPNRVTGTSSEILCTEDSNANRYEFRYNINNGSYRMLNPHSQTLYMRSEPLQFSQAGTYTVQCRPCRGNNCADWSPSCTKTYVIAVPTNTPTPTATPTKTPTMTPRPTSTATPILTKTPTPTAVHIPIATSTSVPTATKTPLPTNTQAPTATTIVDQCPMRSQGDANCDGVVDYVDFVCWRGELIGSKPANCASADFTGQEGKPDGVVNSLDYNIWRKTFLDPLSN